MRISRLIDSLSDHSKEKLKEITKVFFRGACSDAIRRTGYKGI